MPPKITRVRWSASSIPWGLSFNEQTGTFSGTPDEAGEYTVPVTVETNYGKDSKNVFIKVKEKVHWEKVEFYYSSSQNTGLSTDTKLIWLPYQKGIFGLFKNGSLFQYRYSTKIPTSSPSDWELMYANGSGSNVAYNSNLCVTMWKGVITANAYKYIYVIERSAGARIVRFGGTGSSTGTMSITPSKDLTWYGGCYIHGNGSILYVSNNGYAMKITNPYSSNPVAQETVRIGYSTTTNKNCVAFSTSSGKICVTAEGRIVATSSDGNTWEIGYAPDNLIEMSYHPLLEKFIALGENTKLFYTSYDGLSWTQVSYTPVPLRTIRSLAYDPSSYSYCVVGENEEGKTQYSYHSQDLETWIAKKIAETDISIRNVIFAGGTIQSFVIAADEKHVYRIKGTDIF